MECPNCHGTTRLFYKCMQCRHVYKDPNAEEGPQKEVQRRQRDERVRNANNPGGKTDERPKKVTRPAPEIGATAERTAVANHVVVKEDNSDDEY
ncbi:hypothetical protein QFC20_000793 [Naganishia adeliensis]|uniref:Uncharacterized protein n=1 Tax=Naganishia adeliensis TaxID=92952 RepID=A0ACC2WY77_9TREE|nr:hypothetical protein QFC20_000793 [Naganishia adeliensis]